MDREVLCAAVLGSQILGHDSVTELNRTTFTGLKTICVL